MHHQAHGRDDHQHHDRNRIKQNTHINVQGLGEGQPGNMIRNQCGIRTVGRTGRTEILIGCQITEHSHHTQHQSSDSAGYPVRHFHAGQGQKQEAQNGQGEN